MRSVRVALALLVLLGWGLLAGSNGRPVQAAAQWMPGASLGWARQFHATVALTDGTVLVTGGAGASPGGAFVDALTATERYDAATNRWRAVAPLTQPRALHSATTLHDGTVLVVGGHGVNGEAATGRTAERYDPVADRWTPVAALAAGRIAHTATLLNDGTVLVVGGGGYTNESRPVAERYDPHTDRWTPTAPLLHERRQGQAATVLADGRVLITGGLPAPEAGCTQDACVVGPLREAEIYEPATNRWMAAAPLPTPYTDHTATLLPDGRVLVVGGRTAALYDSTTAQWASVARPAAATFSVNHTATVLADGTVLVVGGFISGQTPSETVERFDPTVNRWTIAAPLTVGRVAHTATVLPAGGVLVVGGYGPLAAVEIFADDGAPVVACFTPTGYCVRGRFLQHWRDHGALARHGYPISEERIERLEDGREYRVQYFERVRLEYHPENQPPYDVLLGQFGRQILGGVRPAVPAQPGQQYFPQTGHNVGGRFLAYWEANGGLAQFGLPLSELFRERLEDGQEYTVQYFERARLEHHPENAPPYDVLLGQFGRRILSQR